jgi:hypothetical protein
LRFALRRITRTCPDEIVDLRCALTALLHDVGKFVSIEFSRCSWIRNHGAAGEYDVASNRIAART